VHEGGGADDIDSWSRVDDRMVTYVRNLRERARVALLSNIPADHADAFLAAQSWLHDLDHVAFSGKIGAAKPDRPPSSTASSPCAPHPPTSSSSTTARRTSARRKPSA
jgi:hypothetical protein